ncbi:flippase [Haemophilus paracuniculus]|uniref:Flippase n=1 Tax=Haemophilus paracuniculus TaxID=734 RepID=A0A1T0AQB4_9PAST|nr:flippase [Haemophilus paracuniculus]OOR98187.1 flippase [Haemophilus paracuniculus]
MKAIKDSVIYLGGELLSKSIPFLMLPYLSRKLGVAGYGELSYYQTFLALFVIIVGLSQEGAVARYFYFYGKRSLNLIVNTGYAYTAVVGSLILLGCWIFQAEIIAYLAISAIFQSFLGVQLSVRQCQKQAIPYAVIQLLLSLFSVAITVLMLEFYQTDLVEKRILAILFSNLIVFSIAYFLYSRKLPKKKSYSIKQYKTSLFYLFSFGLPLLLHHASLYLKGQLDRIFIYHQFSEIDLGLYAMGAQIAAVLMILIQAVNKAMIPYLYEGLKTKKISRNKVYQWAIYALLFVPIPAFIMWLIPESVVVWLLGEQFVGTKYFIVLFLISTTLAIPYLVLVNYLFYYGKNKLISICSVISTIIYVVSLMILANTQIDYVPYASIIGAISLLPMLYIMTRKVGE